MATELFDFAAEQIEQHTPLDRLESRGTLRLLLKAAGLEPKTVKASQLYVAIEKLLPVELENRGVGEAEAICKSLKQSIANAPIEGSRRAEGVDEIFGRLGGS